MYLRRSFSVFLSKFSLVYKLLFYIAIIIILMSAIGVSIFMPTYNSLVREVRDTDIFDNAKGAFRLLIKGDFEEYAAGYEALEASYNQAMDLVRSNLEKLYKLYIMIFVLGIVGKYLITLSYVPFMDVVNKFMHSDVDTGVLHNFIDNAKRSSLYSLFDLIIMVPIDLAIFGLVMLVFSLVSSIFSIFTLPFMVAFSISLYMLRVNIFAGWVPAIVYDNMSIGKALIHSLKTAKLRFSRTYLTYVILGVFALSFYVIFGLTTLGLGYIIGIPMITLFYRVLDLVAYYNLNGHRYYLDHDTVVEPRL